MTDDASSRAGKTLAARSVPALEKRNSASPTGDKQLEAHRVAEELYKQRPDWLIFFREILGVGGAISRLFPSVEERAAFEQTPEYDDIQRMLADLRNQSLLQVEMDDKEPTRVITVRLPKSMHEALRAEAYSRQISMNKLCIAKLVKALDAATEGETPTSDEDADPDR